MHTGRIARMPAGRRQLLVAEAAKEFASAGYESASLNRIIERCAMSKSSFYYCFSAKADLYEFVVQELVTSVAADMVTADPEHFCGQDFWQRLEEFFGAVLHISQQREDLLQLGRMFYLHAPDPAKSAVTGTLTAVRRWVEDVLRVGRRCGAVRDDLPMALQAELVFRILQVFDEWTVARFEDLGHADLQALADSQFATIRRTLAP